MRGAFRRPLTGLRHDPMDAYGSHFRCHSNFAGHQSEQPRGQYRDLSTTANAIIGSTIEQIKTGKNTFKVHPVIRSCGVTQKPKETSHPQTLPQQ